MTLFSVEIKDEINPKDRLIVAAYSKNRIELTGKMQHNQSLIILGTEGVDDLITVLQYWKKLREGDADV